MRVDKTHRTEADRFMLEIKTGEEGTGMLHTEATYREEIMNKQN
jgi:hypothetical protein